MAFGKGYIHWFQALETPKNEDEPFDLMLTTYTDHDHSDLRETYFDELVNEKGALSLMYEKKTTELSKTLFCKEMVRQWNSK